MKITKTIRQESFYNLGSQLQNIRLEKGLDLQQVAKMTHFSVKQLHQMEELKCRWGFFQLNKLAYLVAHYDKILKIEFINPPETPQTPQLNELMLD